MNRSDRIYTMFCYLAIVHIFEHIDDWVSLFKSNPRLASDALSVYRVKLGDEPGFVFYNELFAIVYDSRKKKYFVKDLRNDYTEFVPDDFFTELIRQFETPCYSDSVYLRLMSKISKQFVYKSK